ncbi:MAG: TonB-dependent receptor [Bacteroidales bacterium]|nr:TonB-dependent receptor [Bacteroidales bacterium]
MKKNGLKFLFAALILLLPWMASAQAPVKITGTVLENDTSLPVIQAAIQILSPKDSSGITGCVSENSGRFQLSARPGDYIVMVSCLGYVTQYLDIHLTPNLGGTDLDIIRLVQDNELLESAVVTAKVPIVTVSADTLVYNPEAFRLEDDAMLEDLLKKIPGLEIHGETITLHGQPISELLINGERFFAGNLRTGLQSLTADMVEKINAYERESDFARLTGVDDGEQVPVLDIKIKKNMLEGWKGSLNGGYGTSTRYTGRLNANNIGKQKQNTVMASARNTSDMISLNNASRNQLGGGGDGNNHKREAGYTFASNRDGLKVEGNIHYNGNHKYLLSDTRAEHIVSSGSYFTTSESRSLANSNTPKGEIKWEWRVNPKTTLVFKPTFNITLSDTFSSTLGGNFSSDPEGMLEDTTALRPITKTRTDNGSHTYSYRYNYTLYGQIVRRFEKKGRTLSLALTYTGTYSGSDQGTDYLTRYFRISSNPDSALQRNQYIRSRTGYGRYYATISFNEPLGKGFYFQTTVLPDYRRNHSIRDVFDLAAAQPGWELTESSSRNAFFASIPASYGSFREDAISSDGLYEFSMLSITTNLRYTKKKIKITGGMVTRPQWTRLTYPGQEEPDKIFLCNFAPYANLTYTPKKSRKLSFNYKTATGQPSVYDLMPVSSGTNPLYVHNGNPGLKPSLTHTVNFSYNQSNIKKQNSLIINTGLTAIENAVSNSTIYDTETGGRTVTPKNIDGRWTATASLVYNKTFGDGTFSISEHLSGNYNNNVVYLYNSSLKEDEINIANRLMLKQSLDCNFRRGWVELTLNLSADGTDERSLLRPEMDQRPYTLRAGLTSLVAFPWKMRLTTTFYTISQRGYSQALFNRDYYVLNASLSQTLIKKKLTLRVEGNDLLRQLPSMTRNFTSERRSVTTYNGVNSYLIARLVYQFSF